MSGTASGSARRLETYARMSGYAMLAAVPVAYLGAFPAWGPATGLLVGAGQAAANIVVCRHALTLLRQDRRSLTSSEAVVFGGWLVMSVTVLIMVASQVQPDHAWMVAVCAAAAAPLATVSVLLPAWAVLVASAVLAGALGLVAGERSELPTPAAIGFAVAGWILLVFLGMTYWLTGWMLRNVWELEEAHRTAAQLAIAEERLRISRDLHDLFGRTMATVAVKTELAGELVRRDQSAAALIQLADVRSIAEQTGMQVRSVVQGYRDDDLGTELAGARSLLESAGIRCVVRGTPPLELAPDRVSALVWVLREAVTNVIRHSSATECMITIEAGRALRMMITNDGVATAGGDHDHRGHGVIGMHERVTAIGGTLVASVAGPADRFTVEVSLPRTVGSRS